MGEFDWSTYHTGECPNWDKFASAMIEAIQNGKLNVGDVILWGRPCEFLTDVLCGDVDSSIKGEGLTTPISYLTVPEGKPWMTSLTHASLITQVGNTLDELMMIECAWSGVAVRKFLDHCNPFSPRAIQIVASTTYDMKIDFADKQDDIAKVIEDVMKTHVDEKTKKGASYNVFQLLQYAHYIAKIPANQEEPVCVLINNCISKVLSDNSWLGRLLLGSDPKSYFCSQAVATVAWQLSKLCRERGIVVQKGDQTIAPFEIEFLDTLYEGVADLIKRYNDVVGDMVGTFPLNPEDLSEESKQIIAQYTKDLANGDIGVEQTTVLALAEAPQRKEEEEEEAKTDNFDDDDDELTPEQIDELLNQHRLDPNSDYQKAKGYIVSKIAKVTQNVLNEAMNLVSGDIAKKAHEAMFGNIVDLINLKTKAQYTIQTLEAEIATLKQAHPDNYKDKVFELIGIDRETLYTQTLRTGVIHRPPVPPFNVLYETRTNIFAYVFPGDFVNTPRNGHDSVKTKVVFYWQLYSMDGV